MATKKAKKKVFKAGDSFKIEDEVLDLRLKEAHNTVSGADAMVKLLATHRGAAHREMFAEIDLAYPELKGYVYQIKHHSGNFTTEIIIKDKN